MPKNTKSTKKSGKKQTATSAASEVTMTTLTAAVAPALDSLAPPPPWDSEVSDTVSLGQCAQTALDRRDALNHALNGPWAAEDISMIRRVESDGRCLWVMWRGSTLLPG